MLSPAAPFHVAQDAALRASSALADAAGQTVGIYTEVQANAPLPYVVIGEDQALPESLGCGDEAELFATVQLWSRTKPLDKGAQARAIGGALVALLATELAIEGWSVTVVEVQTESYVTDPDQSTHGRLVFRYLLTQSEA